MKKPLLLLAILLAATAAAYLPSIDGQFVLDDLDIIADPRVVDPFGQPSAAWLTWNRPVVAFTFALNRLAVDLDPRGWHLTNVFIHCAVVVLVWLLARMTFARARLSAGEGAALAVAGLFALHPLQTESVAYITQRAEALASGIYLAALLLLLLGDQASSGRRRFALLAGAMGLQVGGLAVKPILVTLPAAWLLYAAVLPSSAGAGASAPRWAWRRVTAALPFFAISALAGVSVLLAANGSPSAGFGIPRLPSHLYLATELRAIPMYLRLLGWPVGQCADWQFPVSQGFIEPAVVGGAALVVAVLAGATLAAVRFRDASGDGAAAARVAAFGALFFVLALVPTSTVFPLLDPFAEHRVYLAAAGVFIAAIAGAVALVRRMAGPERAAAVGATFSLIALVALGSATARRSAVWATPLALWSDAAEKAPRKARVHANLGDALHNVNRPADALLSFYRARDLREDGTVSNEVLLTNIVGTLLSLFRPDEARIEVSRALAESPRDPVALGLLVAVEFVSRREAECERAAFAALAVDPESATALKYLGMIRLARGDVPGALDVLHAAARTEALDPMIYATLGEAEERTGARAVACAAYLRAVDLPGNPWASAHAGAARRRLACP
ncbi:MAG TPA: hypothetical protein VF894_13920 [Anaeromyxobacter sp.]